VFFANSNPAKPTAESGINQLLDYLKFRSRRHFTAAPFAPRRAPGGTMDGIGGMAGAGAPACGASGGAGCPAFGGAALASG